MGLFSNQFLDVIEWNESRNDVMFWMWRNKEIKKNSRLIIRPGQDAIFLYNGRVEGVFTDDGDYDIESEIIPFLSTLKSFKFGFINPLRAEVLFINTKEFLIRWGTKSPINIPAPGMPGGMPIRAFGSFNVKIEDYMTLIDTIAGVKQQFTVEDVKAMVLSSLDGKLMKWIVKEGKDMFNLQINSSQISQGIKEDLDMELLKKGLTVTTFNVESFNYPEQIQKMIDKNAAYGMVGNVGHYQNIAMTEAMEKNPSNSMGSMAQAGVGLQMGMQMANEMQKNMQESLNSNKQVYSNQNNNVQGNTLCPNCKESVSANSKFCSNCGTKINLSAAASKKKFCTECGTELEPGSKFCNECGNKVN